MSLIITTQPSAEPVTLAEAKARLKLTSTADDTAITGYIVSAREFAERVSRRSLAQKVYKAYFDRFPSPGTPLRIPAPPLVSVATVKYLDSALVLQTWDSAEYFVAANQEPGLILPKPSNVYPSAAWMPDSVEVQFMAGAGTERTWWNQVRTSVLNIVVYLFDHPGQEIPENLVQIPKVYVF